MHGPRHVHRGPVIVQGTGLRQARMGSNPHATVAASCRPPLMAHCAPQARACLAKLAAKTLGEKGGERDPAGRMDDAVGRRDFGHAGGGKCVARLRREQGMGDHELDS